MGQMDEAVIVFWRCLKMLVFRGVPFPILAWPRVLVPLNSRPVAYYRKGGTTPCLSFALWGAHFLVGTAIARGIHSAMIIRITKQNGVGSVGGVIIILNRVIGKRLTYGIPAHHCVVLVERLGGFFFDGRHSCSKDSFAGRSGLCCGESLVVSMFICVWDSVGGL